MRSYCSQQQRKSIRFCGLQCCGRDEYPFLCVHIGHSNRGKVSGSVVYNAVVETNIRFCAFILLTATEEKYPVLWFTMLWSRRISVFVRSYCSQQQRKSIRFCGLQCCGRDEYPFLCVHIAHSNRGKVSGSVVYNAVVETNIRFCAFILLTATEEKYPVLWFTMLWSRLISVFVHSY